MYREFSEKVVWTRRGAVVNALLCVHWGVCNTTIRAHHGDDLTTRGDGIKIEVGRCEERLM